jgi:CDGSH-type Zn-finger protein
MQIPPAVLKCGDTTEGRMTTSEETTGQAGDAGSVMKIVVEAHGSYRVEGGVPLVRKTQVVSEQGEPLTWKKGETIDAGEDPCWLCRCGQSQNKPFCDGSHDKAGFKGDEVADPTTNASRRRVFSGQGIEVHRDHRICMQSGFCGTRFANIQKMMAETGDVRLRSLVIAMVERCPSGSFTYTMNAGDPDIEPDLPQQIAITTEMTDQGPIMGPLWVTGGIPVELSNGTQLETRNRVTLCRCGRSQLMPLCDGTHRDEHITE